MSESHVKQTSELQAFKRLLYYDGMLLTSAAFELEQQYFREKSKLHNRSLHGFGIISGLKVTARSGQIVVESGLALDCEGNELVIPTAQAIVPRTTGDSALAYVSESNELVIPTAQAIVPRATGDCATAFVSVRFVENGVAGLGGDAGHTAIVSEGFELMIAPENCNRGHRHLRARWLACGQPHALTLAKLRHSAHGWRVDRGYRAPSIK